MLSPYRSNQYSYGSKGYYSTMPGWTGGIPEDAVDYGINYSHPMLNQDPAHIVHGYGHYGSRKSVFVDQELYAYSNLAHRPAVSSESPTGFSLSGMAASLPNAPERVIDPSDRLLPQVNRTLTGSSSYRTDGLPSYSSSRTSPTGSMHEVGYGSMHSSFDSSYSAPNALPSSAPHPSSSQHDAVPYQASTSLGSDSAYTSGDHALRSAEESSPGFSYTYSDKLDNPRRDSHSSGGAGSGSILPNGQVYVPDSHHSHAPSSQAYVSSQGSAVDGATTSSSRGSGSSGSSHMHTDGHRRSAGNLRGG